MNNFDILADPTLSPGDRTFRGQLVTWMSLRKALNLPVGVMISVDSPGWPAWLAYFSRRQCKTELRRMKLCEKGQGYSRDPKTGRSIMQVPSEYPEEFDAERNEPTTGAYRDIRGSS